MKHVFSVYTSIILLACSVAIAQNPPPAALGGRDAQGNAYFTANVISGQAQAILNADQCVAASNSGTAYTCSTIPTFTPSAGSHVRLNMDVANTGSATLAVNGSPAAVIKKLGNSANLVSGDFNGGQWVSLIYDGTYWQVDGQVATAGNGSSASITLTGTPPSAASTSGLINLGTQNYSDTGMVESFQYSVNGYIYNLIENTSTGSLASACYVVGNSGTTTSTGYGELCMNGTGYTGSGEYNAASATLLDSVGGDLGIGTASANAIHFFVNAGATDSAQVNGTTGAWTFKNAMTVSPTASLTLGTAGSAVGQAIFNNATSGTVTLAPPTGALGTVTDILSLYSGGLPPVLSCGSTGTGNQTCSPAAVNGKQQIYVGQSTLASNVATITFPNTFTSTTSFFCVANDVTTRANPVQMVPASATTATITNTTGASDVIQWVCVGN
jgi:hypothetical protein